MLYRVTHCRVWQHPGFSHISYQQNIHKLWWPRMFKRHCQMSSKGQKLYWWRFCLFRVMEQWRVRLRHSFPHDKGSCQTRMCWFFHSQPCFPYVYSQEKLDWIPHMFLNLFSHTDTHPVTLLTLFKHSPSYNLCVLVSNAKGMKTKMFKCYGRHFYSREPISN